MEQSIRPVSHWICRAFPAPDSSQYVDAEALSRRYARAKRQRCGTHELVKGRSAHSLARGYNAHSQWRDARRGERDVSRASASVSAAANPSAPQRLIPR